MIHTIQPAGSIGASRSGADIAARAALVKLSPRKLKFIRAVEAVARPIVSLVDGKSEDVAPQSPEEVRNILVLEYWHIGDMVMQLPFLQNLRANYPRAHIVLVASPKGAPLLADQGLVDEIIVTRFPWAEHYSRWKKYNPFSKLWIDVQSTARKLRSRQFDLAFAPRPDLRDNFLLWFVKARRRVGYSFGGGGLFLTDHVAPDLANPHQANRSLQLLRHLDSPIVERQPHLRLAQEEQREAKQFLEKLGVQPGDFLVGVQPGARAPLRQWGEQNFLAVAQRLAEHFPVKILWFLEPQREAPQFTASNFFTVSLPMRKFMSVLGECGVLICNDSGPMHIASALKVPVVAVFGPGEPAWFGPLGPNNEIVIRPGFWCRPCLDYCHFDQPYCLTTLSVDQVYEAAEKAVSGLLAEQLAAGSARPEEFVKVFRAQRT